MAVVATDASAACLSRTKGPIAVDVLACKRVQPEQIFDYNREKFAWIKDLDAAGKKQFLNTYRGLLIKALVVRSEAIETGVSGEQGALAGERPFMYMPPSALDCGQILNKRVAGRVNEQCCEGGGDAPCLLGTSLLLQEGSVVGNAGSAAGDDSRQRAKKSKTYLQALKAYRNKKYKRAVALFEQTEADGALDVRGRYLLGAALRELENCKRALRPLNEVYEMQINKKVWADEERVARKAILLLARCHAKMNEPEKAILILNGYLVEPKKYEFEIKQGMRHKDFGWIHTSKEYREWRKAAQQKVR